VSGIGFVAFTYGRKQARVPQALFGLALMVFPYFVSGALAILGIAAVLLFVLWLAIRLGW
jgi:hypothetical protein